jgi:hypothetical protein
MGSSGGRACQGIHRRVLQRQADGEAVAGLRICPLHASLPVEFYQVRRRAAWMGFSHAHSARTHTAGLVM